MSNDNIFKVTSDMLDGDGTFGKFVCKPLDRGYGITLGNSLRRILLSSLEGVAITSIKIDGILHEFTTLPGVREDVSEIILNLKQVRMKFHKEDQMEADIIVDISGECDFTAADLNVNSDIEILNPTLHIATLDEDAHIRMQCHIERGKGYVPSTKNKKDTDVIGVIPIDSIFSPILRAKYEVGNVRVGNEMDYDSLTMEVLTDGSLTAEDAMAESASILSSYLEKIKQLAAPGRNLQQGKFTEDELGAGANGANAEGAGADGTDMGEGGDESIDTLQLSVRASNCLKRANIYTIKELISHTKSDLGKIRNLGSKSVEEIIEKLSQFGYKLKEEE